MRRSIVGLVFAALLVSVDARAQTVGAGEALTDNLNLGAGFPDQIEVLLATFRAETTSFPLGSAAGGFTWMFDPSLGVSTRRSNSFGPVFAERPLTNGRGKLNIGVAYQHTGWDSVAGQKLSKIDLTFTDTTRVGNVTNVRSDTFGSEIDLSTDRTTISATYGVHDRVDVGIVVPIGRTRVSGVSRFRSTFNGAVTEDTPFTQEGSSSGIGDVVLRGKFMAFARPWLDLAGDVNLRLPTGDEENLLGIGNTQTKLSLIGATTRGRVAPHVNVGYTFGGKGMTFDTDGTLLEAHPSDEFDYTFGAEIATHESVTVVADVIGRVLKDSANLSYGTTTSTFGGDSFSETGLSYTPGSVKLLLGTVGVKVKVHGLWLVTGSVLFPMNDNGVKPGLTPVVGFERSF